MMFGSQNAALPTIAWIQLFLAIRMRPALTQPKYVFSDGLAFPLVLRVSLTQTVAEKVLSR